MDGYCLAGGSAGAAVEVGAGVEVGVVGEGTEDEGEEAAGDGAPFPAVLEPRPSFSSVNASIFPLGLRPFLS
jgi:hypothetical protein